MVCCASNYYSSYVGTITLIINKFTIKFINKCTILNSYYDNTTYSNTNNTLTWSALGGSTGEVVDLSKDGKFTIYDVDKAKWVRVVVNTALLPVTDKADTIIISTLNGDSIAEYLTGKLLRRFRDPVSSARLELDLNHVAIGSEFLKPTDVIDLTTNEAFSYGKDSWLKERMMVTSVRPNLSGHKLSVEAVQTKMYLNYGFIAPSGFPDYSSATSDEREYAYIGDSTNKVDGGSIDGYYVW